MINVAIDGPGGAGKSTVAKEVARRKGLKYLDTGALYRAVGYALSQKGIDLTYEKAVEEGLKELDVHLFYDDQGQHVAVNGEDVTKYLRSAEAGQGASKVAVHGCVREKLLDIQRQAAKEFSVIMDGRDIGTVVLPGADLKVYITASREERARRRMKEFEVAGIPHGDLEQIIREIAERDNRDMNRKVAPLRKAEGAVYIDSTNMKFEDVVELVCLLIDATGLPIDTAMSWR